MLTNDSCDIYSNVMKKYNSYNTASNFNFVTHLWWGEKLIKNLNPHQNTEYSTRPVLFP